MFFCKYWEIYQNTCFEEHLRIATSAFLESLLQEHFSNHNLAKETFHETKMVTCSVKGCSN